MRQIDTKNIDIHTGLWATRCEDFSALKKQGHYCDPEKYTTLYRIIDWVFEGKEQNGAVTRFIVGRYKGTGKTEWHVFYPSGRMHMGAKVNMDEAVRMAIKDGWMYA